MIICDVLRVHTGTLPAPSQVVDFYLLTRRRGLDAELARHIEYPMPNKESPTEVGTRASTSLGTNTDQKQNTVVTPTTWSLDIPCRAVPKPPPTREASEDTVGEGWLAVGY